MTNSALRRSSRHLGVSWLLRLAPLIVLATASSAACGNDSDDASPAAVGGGSGRGGLEGGAGGIGAGAGGDGAHNGEAGGGAGAAAGGTFGGAASGGEGNAGSTDGTATGGAGPGGSAGSAGAGGGGSAGASGGAGGAAGAGGGPQPLAATPPMGWNSWNRFGCGVNEDLIKATADAIVSSGMKDAGYRYVNIDDCWAKSRDSDGAIVADPVAFPGGLKALADYVHGKGLALGVYSDRGTKTCAGRPGSQGHETQDAKTYASWGVDYLKYDNCNATLDEKTQYQTMRDALAAAGRPVVFSLCAWAFADWMPTTGQLWRTTGDISDSFASMTHNLDLNEPLAPYAGPGHWNDPDMLEVGNGGMSEAEYASHFSLWAIMAAPLIAGNDVGGMSNATRAILTAPEIIAVDQDPAGKQGTRVAQSGTSEVWSKDLSNPSARAVALFNRGTKAATIKVSWAQIGLPKGSAKVRDLWKRQDLGAFVDEYSVSVAPHATVMVRVTSP